MNEREREREREHDVSSVVLGKAKLDSMMNKNS
jgi:hypothetical protein